MTACRTTICWLALHASLVIAADPPPLVEIRSDDGKVLIAADQIRAYDWNTHTVTLKPKVWQEFAAAMTAGRRLVSGVPFAVTVGGQEIYKGKITSSYSSFSFDLPVINIHPLPGAGLGPDQFRIQLGYPTAQFFKGADPRGDDRIHAALSAAGKLAKTEDHIEWVAKALREMQTIKPGATRAELLRVFVEEGGLSTRTQRRYAYRECPYIKVDVTFEPVGEPAEKLKELQPDKIARISQPFLEWSIAD
jgi:hypothetical protein